MTKHYFEDGDILGGVPYFFKEQILNNKKRTLRKWAIKLEKDLKIDGTIKIIPTIEIDFNK